MKKAFNTLLAGILMVPVLALGMSFAMPSQTAQGLTMKEGATSSKGNGQQEQLFGEGGMFTVIINAALYLIGAVSVLMLIYGGIRYTLSAGNATSVSDAKNTILYAIVGIVVALLAYAIVNWVIGTMTTA